MMIFVANIISSDLLATASIIAVPIVACPVLVYFSLESQQFSVVYYCHVY